MANSAKQPIVESPYRVDIPPMDIPTYVFTSGTPESRRAKRYFDAVTPSKCFSIDEAQVMVKQFGQGLQKLGLRPNDKVLLFSKNNLYFPVFLWGTVASGCVFTAASPTAGVDG
jgi:acyl-CoA synthetase (AMP-forming)/AMP-acid ligase II